ncbi:MAG: hypothetical protein MK165_07485 [Pirellulaceae bacterium]|nr:hypothetical protein [Pirellulaceae bacterium]
MRGVIHLFRGLATLWVGVVVNGLTSYPVAAGEQQNAEIMVIVGASGAPEYAKPFQTWSERWRLAAEAGNTTFHKIGNSTDSDTSDHTQLEQFLKKATTLESKAPLWLVLIGHGTFFRDTAKFNLRGPDISAKELNEWLKSLQRPLVIVNCSSASGPFINQLSATNRVIITATKSGAEHNYSRFGDYLSQAITDMAADVDHDQQVSLLEAFLSAAHSVARFYENDSRLATEHPLLEDNADGMGTPANFFRGIRAVRSAKQGAQIDGTWAHQFHLQLTPDSIPFNPEQLAERKHLESQIEALRQKKSQMSEDAYYAELEAFLLPLAQLYASSKK